MTLTCLHDLDIHANIPHKPEDSSLVSTPISQIPIYCQARIYDLIISEIPIVIQPSLVSVGTKQTW